MVTAKDWLPNNGLIILRNLTGRGVYGWIWILETEFVWL
jgi:hypothetical protein